MSQTRPPFARLLGTLALGLALLMAGLGGSCGSSPARVAGTPEFQQLALRPVPGAGAVVNVAARNLLVSRTDLSLDTRLGTHNLGATYNAATGAWLWTFDITYDGATFVDDTGAVFDTTEVAPGEAISGTHWVVVDGATLQTKGGLVHQFDPAGRLAAVRWASAPWPRIAFVSEPVAGAPRTTRIDQCTAPDACTELFALAYDAAGQLVEVTDRAGRQATFAWDAEGRLVTARDGLDTDQGWPGFRYEYIDGKIAAITNSEGERVEYRFTSKRLEVEVIGAEHPLHVFRYAGASLGLHTTEITDPEGHVVDYRWDGQRRVHAVESIDTGETTTFAWSGRRPVERVLPDGTTTTWTYSGDDVATELQPSGNVVEFTYAPDGVNRASPLRRPIARIEDSLGLVEERSYDAAGRLVAVTNGAGETTTFAYGADEMLASLTGPAGVTTGFVAYGDHGHPTEITRSGSEEAATRIYDAVGNLLERRGEMDVGGVARREYDADRNVAEVHLRSLVGSQGPVEILSVEHRSDGRRTRILRPHGDDAEFDYDVLGRLVARREKADGLWRTTLFERDALGRVTATERPNGMRQETTYDPLGREKARTIGWGSPIAPESTATFTYEDGRRVEILDSVHPGAAETIGYDAAGRPVLINYPHGEVLLLSYDLRSRVTKATLWDPAIDFARTIKFAYDGAGREVSVRDNDEEVLARVYAAGRLAETRYGNGLVRTYGYAEDGTLASTDTVDAAGAEVESITIGTALLFSSEVAVLGSPTSGGFLSLAPTQGATPLAAPRVDAMIASFRNTVFQYDALSNVTKSNRPGSGDELAIGPDNTHIYNAEHNRLFRIENEEGVQHTYAYDAAGYVTERDGVPLSWDAAGRIANIGAEASFAWDTLGRPVASTVMGVHRTHRFGGLVTADAAGNPVSMSLGEIKIDLVTGGHRYRHLDFRGNVAFVTDDAGSIVAEYGYTPYGLETVAGDPAEGPSFARGRALDDLVLLGHRLLDRDAARFLAPDPIYQLINQYAYAFGNPVNFWDPSGFQGTLQGLTATQWAASTALAAIAAKDAAKAASDPRTKAALAGASAVLGRLAVVFGFFAANEGFPWEGDRSLPSLQFDPRSPRFLPPGPKFRTLPPGPLAGPLGSFDIDLFAQIDNSPGLICSGGECVPCMGSGCSGPDGPSGAANLGAIGGGGCSPAMLATGVLPLRVALAVVAANLVLGLALFRTLKRTRHVNPDQEGG